MSNDRNAPGAASDGMLVAQLRRSSQRLDPVRKRAVDDARSAIGWRITDAELAELSARSGAADLPGVRRREPPVLLSFKAPCLDVELEVLSAGRMRRIRGQLVPARPGPVELRHPGGTITVDADQIGRFAADEVEPGPVSLRCEPAEGSEAPVVETDWFLA